MNNDPRRLKLHTKLVSLFPGIKIIFRPPSKIVLDYPCIVYELQSIKPQHSNNRLYGLGLIFRVSYLSISPGNSDSMRLAQLENSNFLSTYVSDDVVHDTFDIHVYNT